jgi:hypothetical protein
MLCPTSDRRFVPIGDVALMFKKREAANLGGLRYVFGQNLGLGQWAVFDRWCL